MNRGTENKETGKERTGKQGGRETGKQGNKGTW